MKKLLIIFSIVCKNNIVSVNKLESENEKLFSRVLKNKLPSVNTLESESVNKLESEKKKPINIEKKIDNPIPDNKNLYDFSKLPMGIQSLCIISLACDIISYIPFHIAVQKDSTLNQRKNCLYICIISYIIGLICFLFFWRAIKDMDGISNHLTSLIIYQIFQFILICVAYSIYKQHKRRSNE